MKALTRFILLIALTLATPLRPQSSPSDADAVFLQVEKTYTWNADGSSRFEYHHVLLLKTHQATNRYFGESFIVFDPRWQSLTIDRSITTMADGKQVPAPENGFIDVLPGSVDSAPDYGYLVERVVSHTGLERGCRIDFAYHIDSKAGFNPWLWGEEVFASQHPVTAMTVRIKIPAGLPLHFAVENGALESEQHKEDGYVVYTWKGSQQPAFIAEEGHPPLSEYAPKLLFSTCPGWEALNNHVQSLLVASAAQNKGAISRFSGTASGSDPLEKVLALQQAIAEEMNTVSLEQKTVGYRMDPLDRLARRNYATEWEKAALLAFSLRQIGLEAHFTLLSRDRNFNPDVALLPVINQAFVSVKLPDGDWHLVAPAAPFSARLDAEKAGQNAWRVGKVFSYPEKLTARVQNRVEYHGELSLDSAGTLNGTVELSLGGAQLPWYQLQKSGGAKSAAQKLMGKLLGSCEVTNTVVKALDRDNAIILAGIKQEKAATAAANGAYNQLSPFKSNLDDWRVPAYQEGRSAPLALPFSIVEVVDLYVSAPQGENWQYDPAIASSVHLESGMFLSDADQSDGKLHFKREIELRQNSYSAAEYPAIRELIVALKSCQSMKIALVK